MSTHPLTPLFEPRSIAVIGVTAAPNALGTRAFQHVREAGFEGPLFAIAARDGPPPSVEHRASLSELPARAELVVIAEPAKHVPAALTQCAQHAARVALILSADYAERDRHAENMLRDAVEGLRHSPLRIVGPHAFGVIRASSHLNASLSSGTTGIARSGPLALIVQSAGVCSSILDWSQAHNIGFSTVASLGAARDLGVGDVLDYLALDRETRAVLLYLEGAEHSRRFMSGLRALARIKPVVVVKASRTRHDGPTGNFGTPSFEDAVFGAALRRAGAVRVTTLSQLFSSAELLSHAPSVGGERLAVITNASGLGVLAADKAFDLGLPLATWSEESRGQLAALTPARTTAAGNPLDLNADATPDRYVRALESCLADRGVDGALVLLAPQLLTEPDAVAAAIAQCEARSRKPVLASFIGGPQVEPAREKLAASGVPTFESPEAAVVAFSQLTRYRRNRELLIQAPDVFKADALDIEGARLIIEAALSQGRTSLSQLESKAVLAAFRVPVTAGVRTQDPNEALVAAQQIGFPVALKIDSLDIADKSEVDGVRLNLRSAVEVRAAHRELMAEVARVKPEARVLGVTVEPMRERREDRELLAGIRRDATFGPVIALGLPSPHDGSLSYALPPLNTRLASDLIEQAEKHASLAGISQWHAARSGALVSALLRLSDLACELPEVQDLTIDPLLADGEQVVALDAHVTVKHVPASQRKYGQLAIAPYPRELVENVQLADGTTIVIRPIRPEDAQLEQDLVRDLSLETRRFRFMHALSRLTDEMLVRFTQLDYDRELGLIATQPTAQAEIPLGVSRYVGDGDELGCEFAVVVADAWQKRGVASQLMRALISAARVRHFTNMHGDVLADNTRMLHWMERLGFSIKSHPEDPMLRIVTLVL